MEAALSVVATPIGNLEDITLRALRILKEADFILCEDTRVASKLLSHYQITTPLISYHQHSGVLKVEKIKELIREGKKMALISDAGTPGVSDPGSKLVSELRQEFGKTLKMEIIPGSSALTAALSLAGVGFDRFSFLGFLPHKKGRQTMLIDIITSSLPTVIYESKHRIIKLLQEITSFSQKLNIPKEILVFREISKLYESFYQGSPENVLAEIEENPHNLKGEFVVLIKNRS